MKTQEADRIIAEFMGLIYNSKGFIDCPETGRHEHILYSESLDAQVPVWNKLGRLEVLLDINDLDVDIKIHSELTVEAWGLDIQQAAAIATAKAILKVQSNEEHNDE